MAVLGTVMAAFAPTFLRRLETSKTAEAGLQLAQLHRLGAAYYAASHATPTGPLVRCLPPQGGPAPAEPTTERAEVAFQDPTTPGHATFRALGFQPDTATRYSYEFVPTLTAGCDLEPAARVDTRLFVVRAHGDLDGDGEWSLVERAAGFDDSGQVVPLGALRVERRLE